MNHQTTSVEQTEQAEDALMYFSNQLTTLVAENQVNFEKVEQVAQAAKICNNWLNDHDNTDDLATYFADRFEESDCWENFSPLTIIEMQFA